MALPSRHGIRDSSPGGEWKGMNTTQNNQLAYRRKTVIFYVPVFFSTLKMMWC